MTLPSTSSAVRAALALAAASVVLTGCAGSPSPVEPDGADGVSVGGQPADDGLASALPAIALTCDDLLVAADPQASFGVVPSPTTAVGAGVGDYLGLAAGAVTSAGGVQCRWSDREAGVDLQVLVLPDAAEQWAALSSEVALTQSHAGRFGDQSFHSCMVGCRADVLAGGHWVAAQVSGAASEDAGWEIVDRVVAAVAAADSGAPVRAAAQGFVCDTLVPEAARTAAVGAPLAADTQFVPTQPVMLHAAVVKLGGTHCFWRGEVSGAAASVRVGVVPGGADAWQAHWGITPDAAVAPVEWQEAPALGDEARAGCFERSCFVSVRSGADWVSVSVLHDGADRMAAALALAEGVLSVVR